MEIKSIKNKQKEAFIRNLEKGLMATEGVYVDNWFNRKKGRVGMTYAQAQAMEDRQNSMKKEKTPGSNRHTIKYGGVGTSTINAAQKAGFSDDDILKEKKVGENGYSMTLKGDVPLEKLQPVMEALRKEYGKNIEFDKDIDKNGNTIFTAERTVKKTLMHKIDEGIDKLKGKASKILKKKDKKEPEGDDIMKEIEKWRGAQKDSIEKLDKLKWTIKKSDKFKTRNGHPATDRISINIERPEGPNSDDFTEMVDNIYIDTPKGRIYDIGEGRYAIPHPEYEEGKNNGGIPQYRNVDAKGAADFLDGKDFYDISSESYHRGEKYNKLSEKWTNYLKGSLKEHNDKAMKIQKEKQNPFQ